MKIIETIYDEILKVNIDLCSYKYSTLREEVKSWYKDVDLSLFDRRNEYSFNKRDESKYIINKISGLISNYFYAYKDKDGKMFLLDGYNRLLSDYGDIDIDPTVYLKVIYEEDITDGKLMGIMFTLNAWKLSKNGSEDSQFHITNFLDRGFKLFLYTKFNILISKRLRYHDDIKVLDEYFRRECESVAYFNYNIDELFFLFKQENIIKDFKHILKSNDYDDTIKDDENIFPHYDTFLQGYTRFLSRRRLIGDLSEYLFDTYLTMLKADKKFFNKLKGMSGNDSTRKNVFLFFDKIEQNLK